LCQGSGGYTNAEHYAEVLARNGLVTYNYAWEAVLKECFRAGEAELAKSWLGKARESKALLESPCYEYALRALAKEGKHKLVAEVITALRYFNVNP
jgi:hypothetical protein